MCSCKSKKLVSDVQIRHSEHSELSYFSQSAEVDTSKTIYTEQVSNIKILKETITHTIYDTDKNVVKETTKTERTFVEDSQTDVAKEEQRRVGISSKDSLDHFADVRKMVDSEVKEETKDSTESFWKWIGIVIGIAIAIFFAYLCRKLRIN